MINLIINLLNKSKAINISLFKNLKNSCIADYIIIVSGTSERHRKYIAKNIIKSFKCYKNKSFISLEGEKTDWILIDIDIIIIHIMSNSERMLYKLEDLYK